MIPIVSREALEEAMGRFDVELRGSEEWANWETNRAHKYAIEHDGKRYPVKKVVSLAAGLAVSEFSGGQGSGQANAYAEERGFRIIRLTSGNTLRGCGTNSSSPLIYTCALARLLPPRPQKTFRK